MTPIVQGAPPEPSAVVAALPAVRPFVAPEELARTSGHAHLLRLGANESAFGPAPATAAAMREAIGTVAWYGDPESADLRGAVAAHFAATADEIVVGAGIDDLLALVVRAYLGTGDAAVATAGTYPTFAYFVAGAGARLETIPYAAAGALQLDALARAAHACSARVAYVANPDNPSGSFATRAELEAFLAALPPTTLLVLDEAYAEFAPQDELLPPSFRDARVVRARTFSKAYGLAGARIAYAHGDARTIASLGKIRTQYGVNRIAQAGALAALGDDAFVASVVRETALGRDEYRALAARHGCATLPSATNFVCIDLGSRARADAMVAALLQRGVFVRKPATPPIDGYVRVTVGTASQRARFAKAFGEAHGAVVAKFPLP